MIIYKIFSPWWWSCTTPSAPERRINKWKIRIGSTEYYLALLYYLFIEIVLQFHFQVLCVIIKMRNRNPNINIYLFNCFSFLFSIVQYFDFQSWLSDIKMISSLIVTAAMCILTWHGSVFDLHCTVTDGQLQSD